MNSVTLAIVALVLLAGLSIFMAVFRHRQPLFAVPAIATILLSLAMPFFNSVLASSSNVSVINIGPFRPKDAFEKNVLLFGEPVAPATVKDGIPLQYFAYVRYEYHEEIQVPEWQYQFGNIGTELMNRRGIKADANPSMPPVIASYLAGEASRGVDILRYFGHQLTNPRKEEDRVSVYFEKTVLSYPVSQWDGENDPASVRREPVGRILWNMMIDITDPADPWSPIRRTLAIWAVLFLAISLAPFAIGRFRRKRFGTENF